MTATSTDKLTRPRSSEHVVRKDIQALRAYAVLAVVLYHLWPRALPGGYVGVDVFFVISGYLITGQLLRKRTRGRIHLGEFWVARARRLLPASLLVLLVSVALTLLWAPQTLIAQYLRSIVGSTLYIENWVLASDAVDYLAQDNAPPIAQHYWSLSVEEQFYIAWPLLIVIALWGATRVAERKRALIMGGTAIALASFALCVWLTLTAPGQGYFSTLSRVWEFALGGIVALLPALRAPRRVHGAILVGAWCALAVTLFLFNSETLFPGPAALLPASATAMLILAGPTLPKGFAGRLLGSRLVQWVGDQSYGIYLWHWPLIVIAPAFLHRETQFLDNLTILAVSIILAAATMRFVEDPIRFGRIARTAKKRVVAATVVLAMGVVVASAGIPMIVMSQAAAAQKAANESSLIDPTTCTGAASMIDSGCAATREKPIAAHSVLPALAAVMDDTGGAFSCYDSEPLENPTSCSFGSDRPDAVRIALVGDSHAAMLIPGLRAIAAEYGWHIDTYVGRGCDISDEACARRQQSIDAFLTSSGYDILVETGRNNPEVSAASRETMQGRYEQRWAKAKAAGLTVVAIADNPFVPEPSIECLGMATEFSSSTCAFPEQTDQLAADPLRAAARASDASLVDLTDAYCTSGTCPVVAGGVVIWRDQHHITATFSQTLAPFLAERIQTALPEVQKEGPSS